MARQPRIDSAASPYTILYRCLISRLLNVVIFTCLFLGLLLSACAKPPIFSDAVLREVDRTVIVRDLVTNPDSYKGRMVEIGGQILQALSEGDEVMMLVRALPIRKEPVYGPYEKGRSLGMFVVRFAGRVGTQDSQAGNMIVVIGPVMGALPTASLSDVPVRRLTVNAECFHIWRTQGDQIDQFPWQADSRYWPLIEQTYCAGTSNVILPVS